MTVARNHFTGGQISGPVHTTREKFENAAVRPTVHTDASRERSFPKTLFKLEEFENADFAF